jgi:hypothetical protein
MKSIKQNRLDCHLFGAYSECGKNPGALSPAGILHGTSNNAARNLAAIVGDRL